LGIGVSFRGHNGQTRQFNLTDVPKVGDEAAKVLGATSGAVRDVLSQKLLPDINNFGGGGGGDDHRVKLTDSDNDPGPLDEKMDPNGSVTVGSDGVKLKGDGTPIFGDSAAYGIVGGERGFFPIAKYDGGTKDAKRLGIVGVGGPDPENDSDTGAFDAVWQTVSRLTIETDDLGRKILYQFERDERKTAFGRVVEVSGERKSAVGFITENVNVGGSDDPDNPDNPDEPDNPSFNGVISVNGAQGAVSIIGGEGISVSTSGNTIKISANADKENEDLDPNVPEKDPCEHEGGGDGVKVGDDGVSDEESGSGWFGDGVPAEDGDVQSGVRDCDK
jgi:hypothetical protein